MTRSIFTTSLIFAILLISEIAAAEELVREFRGNRSTHTAEFEVRAPWLLDWRISTDYPGQIGIEISLLESGTGAFQGSVLKTKWPGNGVRLFQEGGKFQFNVISNLAEWTLKVKQLTREEAKLYTPRTRD